MSRTDKDRPWELRIDDPTMRRKLAIFPIHPCLGYIRVSDKACYPGHCDFGSRNNAEDFKHRHDANYRRHICNLEPYGYGKEKTRKDDRKIAERSYRRKAKHESHMARRSHGTTDPDVPSPRVFRYTN